MITDMTRGSPTKILIKYSIPLLLSVMFQQFYNMADLAIAGKFESTNALAAVSASYPVTMIFMAFAVGCSTGCSVVISQLFGAGKYKQMKTAVFTSLISSVALSIVLTCIGRVASNPILVLLKTQKEILNESELYLNIYVWGLVFLFLYNICTGVFTALGDSRTPLYFLIASSLGNVALDLLFVAVFKMGVAGVAWATFICQGICSILALVCLLRRIRTISTEGAYSYYSLGMLRRISAIAVPSIFQQSFVSVGNLFVQGLVNSFGVAVTAGYGAAIKLNTFSLMCLTSISGSVASFTAQNIGARSYDRVKRGFKIGIPMILSVAAIFSLVYTIFSKQIISLFMDAENADNENAILEGVKFLKYVGPFYFIPALKVVSDGVLKGAGAMRGFLIATFTDLILRVALSFILAKSLGPVGIWTSWPIGWGVGALISQTFTLCGDWKRKNVIKERN